MSKIQKSFFCQNCGHESLKWLGKCPSCNEWNQFVEEIITKQPASINQRNLWETDTDLSNKTKQRTKLLSEVESHQDPRILTQDPELNRVLGGGIVPGSVILVAGEPGIGKSTLLLQMALNQQKKETVLYISGEESPTQIKLRSERLKKSKESVLLLTEVLTTVIFQEIKKASPHIIIIDSIQTLQNPMIDAVAGSVSQIRECAGEFIRFAKETNTAVFLIGHVNKEGMIAGPKILEHMVDTVLQFEGDRYYSYRILRTLKNRYGSASELGVYEMTTEGMTPIIHPSQIFINQNEELLSGTAIAATMEGQRPLLVEVQALVSPSVYSTPQRTATGIELKRLQLLIAVLEKKAGYSLSNKDVFINIAGGLKLEDPSVDLAIIVAMISSYLDVATPTQMCFASEVGLNGEMRSVSRIEQRIVEAEKMGFKTMVISKNNKKKNLGNHSQMNLLTIGKVEDLGKLVFKA